MLVATISDNNTIFAEGLKVILEDNFGCFSIQVKVTDGCEGLDVLRFHIYDDKDNKKFNSDALKIINSNNDISDTSLESKSYIYRDDNVSSIVCKLNFVLNLLFFKALTTSFLYQKKLPKVLSDAESKVISLISQGHSVTEVSKILNKSVKTVSTQKKSVMNKINVTNNADFYTWIFNGYDRASGE